jgi:hypothetical protein
VSPAIGAGVVISEFRNWTGAATFSSRAAGIEQELPMNPRYRSNYSLLAVTIAALLLAPAAGAQSPGEPGRPTVQPVKLTMEQRHVVKEIIKDMKIEEVSGSPPTKAGDIVPAGVVLRPVPVEVSSKVPQLKLHSFYVKDSRVVLVDPNDNKITDVVD